MPDEQVPATIPASSLQGGAAEAKGEIENLIPDPASRYWRGDEAPLLQAAYRGLLRGEEAGSPVGLMPLHEPDDDVPESVDQYNIAAADGARSMTDEDREIIDWFLQVAHGAGLGQRKVRQAIGWALTIPGLTAAQFKDLAIAAEWSDAAIKTCLAWHKAEVERQRKATG